MKENLEIKIFRLVWLCANEDYLQEQSIRINNNNKLYQIIDDDNSGGF